MRIKAFYTINRSLFDCFLRGKNWNHQPDAMLCVVKFSLRFDPNFTTSLEETQLIAWPCHSYNMQLVCPKIIYTTSRRYISDKLIYDVQINLHFDVSYLYCSFGSRCIVRILFRTKIAIKDTKRYNEYIFIIRKSKKILQYLEKELEEP